jgi:hypothetical protein
MIRALSQKVSGRRPSRLSFPSGARSSSRAIIVPEPMKVLLALLLLVFALVAGCAGAATSTSEPVTTAEAAVARVVAENPALAGIEPENPDMIGACCFWRAEESADGYLVEFEVGWGDCPAGCIDRHRWTYEVARDGSVELVAEEGPPVPAGVPGAEGAG